jgi:hypothetical protein
MVAGKFEIYIEQGALFELLLTCRNPDGSLIDLTGYSFEGMVRKATDDANPFLTFNFTILNQITNPGQVRMYIPSATTEAISIPGPVEGVRTVVKYLYDVYWITGGEKYRILEGAAKISAEATKPGTP